LIVGVEILLVMGCCVLNGDVVILLGV